MNSQSQTDLFSSQESHSLEYKTPCTHPPLAYKLRPHTLDEFYGQEELLKKCPFLFNQQLPGLILWGPPGCGKTTLAHLLAKHTQTDLYSFNAVLGGVNDLKKLIEGAEQMKKLHSKHSIIFIDEIHRFNKAQQDALLPYVEKGDFTFIGATTQNPRTAINKALLSRVQILELKGHTKQSLLAIMNRALKKENTQLDEQLLMFICDYCGQDARKALNYLELALTHNQNNDLESIKNLIKENSRDYDKDQDRHYDVISAFIKSMRGSDPDAALLWLAVMLDGGEDPVFLARRLMIFASEDVGNADPIALLLATSALNAIGQIGMPEARIPLAQVTAYLASTHKSNASYKAINEAMNYVSNSSTLLVPDHLKNYPPPGSQPYLYPHDMDHFPYAKQNYTCETKLPPFYRPTEYGREKQLKERLEYLKNL